MLIVRKSPFSGEVTTKEINVTEEQLSQWKDEGVCIQKAMPHLTPGEREFIMTGITPEEWETMFPEYDMDDDDWDDGCHDRGC